MGKKLIESASKITIVNFYLRVKKDSAKGKVDYIKNKKGLLLHGNEVSSVELYVPVFDSKGNRTDKSQLVELSKNEIKSIWNFINEIEKEKIYFEDNNDAFL